MSFRAYYSSFLPVLLCQDKTLTFSMPPSHPLANPHSQQKMKTACNHAVKKKMSTRKRKHKTNRDEAWPDKRLKFDVRRKYLLTPKKRQERNDAVAKLQSLCKAPTSNLDVLPNECILQIMHHLELPKYLPGEGHPETKYTSSLVDFMGSTKRVKHLWKEHASSILIGMEEKQYPEYLGMFGKMGQETEEQLQNLRCAIATERWWANKNYEPEVVDILHLRRELPRVHKLRCIMFLEGVAQTVEHQLCLCRKAGFGGFERRRRLSEDTVKRALLTLWRMGWKKPEYHERRDQRWPGSDVESCLEVAPLLAIFHEQPEEVRSCIKELLHYLGSTVAWRLDLEYNGNAWIADYCAEKIATEEESQETTRWMRTTVNATVLAAIITHSVEEALAIISDFSVPATYMNFSIRSRLDTIYALKPAVDNKLGGGVFFQELEGHVQVMNGMGAYDIFQNEREAMAGRRTDGLPFKEELRYTSLNNSLDSIRNERRPKFSETGE